MCLRLTQKQRNQLKAADEKFFDVRWPKKTNLIMSHSKNFLDQESMIRESEPLKIDIRNFTSDIKRLEASAGK